MQSELLVAATDFPTWLIAIASVGMAASAIATARLTWVISKRDAARAVTEERAARSEARSHAWLLRRSLESALHGAHDGDYSRGWLTGASRGDLVDRMEAHAMAMVACAGSADPATSAAANAAFAAFLSYTDLLNPLGAGKGAASRGGEGGDPTLLSDPQAFAEAIEDLVGRLRSAIIELEPVAIRTDAEPALPQGRPGILPALLDPGE